MTKFIVYEGAFKNRWIAREVVDETEGFYVLKVEGSLAEAGLEHPTRKRKKSSIGQHGLFETRDEAEQAARALTSEIERHHELYTETIRVLKNSILGNDT